MSRFLFLLLAITISGVEKERTDLLDLASGAKILQSTGEYGGTWTAQALIDGTTDTGWCSPTGNPYPHTILIELPKSYPLKVFAVDNTKAQESGYPGISARKISVHGSNSLEEGFRFLFEEEALKGMRKEFYLADAFTAKWIKIEILSNWGNSEYTELMELEGYSWLEAEATGKQAPRNVLNSGDGARIAYSSGEYGGEWTASALFDGDTKKGWCSPLGKLHPHTFIIDLPEAISLAVFATDNTEAQESGYPGISARKIKIYGSFVGRDDFHLITTLEIPRGGKKEWRVQPIHKINRLKIVVHSNWGNPDYTELMEFSAYSD